MDAYLIGNFPHPFFKGALVKTGDSGTRLWNDMINYICSQHDSAIDQKEVPERSNEKENRPTSRSEEWDELVEIAERHVGQIQRSDQIVKTPLQLELDNYFTLAQSSDVEGTSVLQWWRENEVVLPQLARMARAYLSIPTTSSPSERVFSCSGNIVTSQRQSLDTQTVEKLVYINMNSRRVDINSWNIPIPDSSDGDIEELSD